MLPLVVLCTCAVPPRPHAALIDYEPDESPPSVHADGPAPDAAPPTAAVPGQQPIDAIAPDATAAPEAPVRRTPLAWNDLAAVVHRRRGVAEDYLVLPHGLELGAHLRTVSADGGIGPGRIHLTDLALFDTAATLALSHGWQLEASSTVLAKQPDAAREPLWQGAALGLRRAVAARTAVDVTAGVAPLLGLSGLAESGSASLIHRHALDEIVAFELSGGAIATRLPHAALAEVATHFAVIAREPAHIWGGWLAVGFAVPLAHRGDDPVSAMPLSPKPRLDLALGNDVRLGRAWDLSAELALVDRGDLADPATRLPILDGGFDQLQVRLGVTRRLE